MIDTLSEGINIKELTVTEPARRPEVPFDVKKDITQEHWDKIKSLAQSISNLLRLSDDGSSLFLEHISLQNLSLIAPDVVRPHISDDLWAKMSLQLKNMTPDGTRTLFLLVGATTLKLLNPQKAAAENLISDEKWMRIQEVFQQNQEDETHTRDAFEIARQVRLLAPDRSKDFHISDTTWDYTREKIGNYQEQIDESSENPAILASWIADAKIIDPKKIDTLAITDKTWEKIWKYEKNLFATIMEKDITPLRIGSNLAEMTIFAASEIHIANSGVRFVNQKQSDSDVSQPMPEVRNF